MSFEYSGWLGLLEFQRCGFNSRSFVRSASEKRVREELRHALLRFALKHSPRSLKPGFAGATPARQDSSGNSMFQVPAPAHE